MGSTATNRKNHVLPIDSGTKDVFIFTIGTLFLSIWSTGAKFINIEILQLSAKLTVRSAIFTLWASYSFKLLI
jgi:hypothetical protein